ncbi:MAG: hypothetical protein ACK52I_29625 [Pseudomonadota bacterium]
MTDAEFKLAINRHHLYGWAVGSGRLKHKEQICYAKSQYEVYDASFCPALGQPLPDHSGSMIVNKRIEVLARGFFYWIFGLDIPWKLVVSYVGRADIELYQQIMSEIETEENMRWGY